MRALDLLAARVFYRVFVSAEPVDDAYLDRFVDAVVRARRSPLGAGATRS